MSAVALLSDVICQRARVSVLALSNDPDFSALLNCGLLRKVGVVDSFACMECEEPHAAEVLFEAGEYGYFCPELGFIHLSRQQIAGIESDLPPLIARLASAFGCTRRKATPVHGTTWRIGAVKTDHGDIAIYFHPRLRDEGDSLALADALSREVVSKWRLVVTAGGRLPVSGAVTLTLSELVELSPDAQRLIPVADPSVIVGVPVSTKTGAPNRFGDRLMALIRSRITSGASLPGRNAEAKAVLALLQREHPSSEVPSLPTVRAYVSKARSG